MKSATYKGPGVTAKRPTPTNKQASKTYAPSRHHPNNEDINFTNFTNGGIEDQIQRAGS